MNTKDLKNMPFKVYGDTAWRGACPTESQEQVTFFNRLRTKFPTSYGVLAVHPRNEGLKTGGQIRSVAKHRAEGMTPGAADIIIPGRVTFVCEMKRQDASKSAWQDGQIEYLTATHNAGAFACVAFGCEAAWYAFYEWMRSHA